MKVAICGYPPFALQVQAGLQNSSIEFKFFIADFVSDRGEGTLGTNLPLINFFEFRWLVNAGELDGVIIAETVRSDFAKNVIQVCKFYNIPKVGVMDLKLPHPLEPIYWLDTDKSCIPYLNVNLVDGCNLNCKGCTHFATFFGKDEIYPLETFRRDLRQLSQMCDVVSFRLLGGEPLLLKNLDEYVEIARQYFPKTNLGIVTNGLLLSSVSQKILDALRKNNFVVYVSVYPPTEKILDKIVALLDQNKIFLSIIGPIKTFGVFMSLHDGNNPEKARQFCSGNDICRFLRDGKIYKCPPDALKFRFAEKFGIKGLPASTSADLYSADFSALLEMLDGNIEMCSWCSEQPTRRIPWQAATNPKLEDWLADPEEMKIFH